MKVVFNNKTYTIGWNYDDPKAPLVTKCIVKDEEKNVIGEVQIKKYHLDTCNKDKARRFSLGTWLSMQFPGAENKGTRKIFWDAYLNRNKRQEKEISVEV